MRCSSVLMLAVLVQAWGVSFAAEPTPDGTTLLATRGKLVLSDDLNQPLGKEWRVAKGKWEVVDGVLHGSELKADMHAAVARHALPLQNAIIQYSFQLDGTKMTTLSINDDKEHVCRVVITPNGFRVQKDDHDHAGPDKAVVLEDHKMTIAPSQWHTLVVEILGPEMLAQLDDQVAFGSHPAIDVQKANFGFTVSGESNSLRNVRVWEALPNKDWEATKAKLLEARGNARASAK